METTEAVGVGFAILIGQLYGGDDAQAEMGPRGLSWARAMVDGAIAVVPNDAARAQLQGGGAVLLRERLAVVMLSSYEASYHAARGESDDPGRY